MARKKKVGLDAFELVILSAVFARSNMGQGLPSKRDVERLKGNIDWRTKQPAPPHLETAVNDICGKFMESDEHQEMFVDEARDWQKTLKKETPDSVAQTWGDIAELYWRDPATYVDNKRWPNG